VSEGDREASTVRRPWPTGWLLCWEGGGGELKCVMQKIGRFCQKLERENIRFSSLLKLSCQFCYITLYLQAFFSYMYLRIMSDDGFCEPKHAAHNLKINDSK
jgi:hypothetical protein